MKVITLIENTSHRNDLMAEHGLSLYIETEHHRILFDAGQSDAFARNAEILGIDLSRVDFAVVSHGHYDHGGGLRYFLGINDHAPVYMSSHAFGQHYNASGKYIGLDPALMNNNRLRLITGEVCVCDGITLHCRENTPQPYPVRPFGLTRMEQGTLINEDFRHEIYMTIRHQDKTILFSGCSHRGILNIIHWFRPDVCFGGFHFSKLETAGADAISLQQAGESLAASKGIFYTGHCTGCRQYEFLKEIMQEKLQPLSCGVRISI